MLHWNKVPHLTSVARVCDECRLMGFCAQKGVGLNALWSSWNPQIPLSLNWCFVSEICWNPEPAPGAWSLISQVVPSPYCPSGMRAHPPTKLQALPGLPCLCSCPWLLQQPGGGGPSSATFCSAQVQVGSKSGTHPAASWGRARQC